MTGTMERWRHEGNPNSGTDPFMVALRPAADRHRRQSHAGLPDDQFARPLLPRADGELNLLHALVAKPVAGALFSAHGHALLRRQPGHPPPLPHGRVHRPRVIRPVFRLHARRHRLLSGGRQQGRHRAALRRWQERPEKVLLPATTPAQRFLVVRQAGAVRRRNNTLRKCRH